MLLVDTNLSDGGELLMKSITTKETRTKVKLDGVERRYSAGQRANRTIYYGDSGTEE